MMIINVRWNYWIQEEVTRRPAYGREMGWADCTSNGFTAGDDLLGVTESKSIPASLFPGQKERKLSMSSRIPRLCLATSVFFPISTVDVNVRRPVFVSDFCFRRAATKLSNVNGFDAMIDVDRKATQWCQRISTVTYWQFFEGKRPKIMNSTSI